MRAGNLGEPRAGITEQVGISWDSSERQVGDRMLGHARVTFRVWSFGLEGTEEPEMVSEEEMRR